MTLIDQGQLLHDQGKLGKIKVPRCES